MASHVAAAARSTASSAASSSRTTPRSTASHPAAATRPSEHRPVALADLPGLQRATVVDQLVAGAQHGHAHARCTDTTTAALTLASTAGDGRGDDRAGRVQRRADAHVVADGAHGDTGVDTAQRSAHVRHRRARSVSSTITTASAPAGTGAPVMMRIASPGAARGPCTHRRPPRRPPGSSTGASATRRGDHGVAVDRTVGERRHVLRGHHRRGQHAADGARGTAASTGRKCRAAFEHVRAGLGDVDHGRHGTVAPMTVVRARSTAAHDPGRPRGALGDVGRRAPRHHHDPLGERGLHRVRASSPANGWSTSCACPPRGRCASSSCSATSRSPTCGWPPTAPGAGAR